MEVKYSGIRESKENRFFELAYESQLIEEKFETRCLKHAEKTFSLAGQCQEINSMNTLLTTQDSVFIIHAPQGCVGCSSLGVDLYRVGQEQRGEKYIKNPRIIVTNLDSNDIVFGGEKKLRGAIQKAVERYNPKIIFVFLSCSSAIIGDDVESVVSSMQPEVEAKLVPIHCEGFKSKSNASGYDAAFIAIEKYLLPKKKITTNKNLINLFSPMTVSFSDTKEMARLLEKIGLEVNILPFYSSLESIEKISQAAASTAICKVFADEFMISLEKKYQIPYSHTVMPIGIKNTDEWFLDIARLTGREEQARQVIEEEHQRVFPLIMEIKERLQGKRVLVSGGEGRSLAIAALMEDFGMSVNGLATPVYDNEVHKDIKKLNAVHGNYPILFVHRSQAELTNLVRKQNPDVLIGGGGEDWARMFGYPTVNILDPKHATMGYNGLFDVGLKIADVLENPGFNIKMSKYVKPPLRDAWYQESPFKYIVGLEDK